MPFSRHRVTLFSCLRGCGAVGVQRGRKGKSRGKVEVKVCLDSGDQKRRGGGDEHFLVQHWKICRLSPGVRRACAKTFGFGDER